MAGPTNQLFNVKTIKRLCDDVELTKKQKDAAKEWITLLEQNKLEDETSNYPKFMQIILQDVLGYPIKEINYESGNVEFQFANSAGKSVLCFEAKGTSVKDLFAPQRRAKKEHETPIKQTWDYIGSIGLDYGICTNYKDFVLITKDAGYSKYHKFDFLSIKGDEEKLKEFVGIFSKERIIDKGFVKKLHEESITQEREFTNEFYKLFHETRLMLIKEFSNSADVTKEDAIHYAQLFLNRLIFMYFAEDNQLIPERIFTKRIQEVLNSTLISEHSKLVSDEILGFFQALNKGSHRLNIFGFNGGLYEIQIPAKIYFSDLKDSSFFNDVKQNSNLSKKVKPNETLQKIIRQYGNDLNPIITNLLIMDSYDFTSEVNVNILGHIFEQSISDLEELRGEGISKRKREGVYYTPEYITDYICRNTIIPYLSKDHASTAYELVEEYANNLDELEKKFKEIKILDPACGSGAFLIKAVDILLEVHREIQLVKESRGKYSAGDQFSLAKWSEESEIQQLIENNIFGVDINEESVEITKLSLFLKLVGENKKLIDLSKNIRVGNSLINDKSVDPKAFDWEKEFKEIFDNGKFDIIIGNPPYLRIQGLHESHEHTTEFIEKNYESATGRYDFYILFIEKGAKLLKQNGLLGLIIPHKFTVAQFGIGIRKFLSQKRLILSFLSFGHNFVFEEVSVYTGILILKNLNNKYLAYNEIRDLNNETIESILARSHIGTYTLIEQSNFDETPWNFSSGASSQILEKIQNSGPNILHYFDNILQGIVTGDNSIYCLQGIREKDSTIILLSEKTGKEIELEKEVVKPLLLATDVKRYLPLKTQYYVIYPYIIENQKQRPLEENELQKKYPKTYEYLIPFKQHLITLKRKYKTNPTFWHALHRSRQIDWFNQEKIVTPQITFGCNMTLDEVKLFHMDQVYSFIKKSTTKINNRYFLAFLNSKLLWYFIKNTGVVLRGGYFSFKTKYLENFHIPEPSNKKIEDDLIEKVTKILKLKKETTEKYLTFLDLLKINFKLNRISKTLEKFYELSFDSFVTELSNNFKIKIHVEDQVEWMKQFESFKKQICELNNQIARLDNEINNLIYKLYTLNDDEISIVEENYPTT